MDLNNASTLLARFNEILKELEIGTLVPQMDHWREQGLDAITFAKHTLREGDPIMQTRKDYVKLFCAASPIFVTICQWILQHIWDEEKLLVIEQVPLIAWYWELACHLLLAETTTMHSGLDQKSRTQIVEDFNAKGGLKILIIMYNVGGQGINLQKQCHHVIVATPAISYAKFLQAIGRVIRVSTGENYF
jgi:ERCC4-related helicase